MNNIGVHLCCQTDQTIVAGCTDKHVGIEFQGNGRHCHIRQHLFQHRCGEGVAAFIGQKALSTAASAGNSKRPQIFNHTCSRPCKNGFQNTGKRRPRETRFVPMPYRLPPDLVPNSNAHKMLPPATAPTLSEASLEATTCLGMATGASVATEQMPRAMMMPTTRPRIPRPPR